MAERAETCAACRFGAGDARQGMECRRRPPRLVVLQSDFQQRVSTRFPDVGGTDWCGEFQPRAEAARAE